MLNPWTISDSTHQPRQSLLAILTGGWFGKGPGNGSIKLGFLPEDSTDFIYAVYCEEWGFLGAALLIGLVVVWIWLARKAAVRAGDSRLAPPGRQGFGRVLAGSMGFLVALQAALHMAVVLVVMPPTGVTLPFISAGGSALVFTACAVAMMVSVTSRRPRAEQAETPRDDPAPACAPAAAK
jgi:cell division protein FtsW